MFDRLAISHSFAVTPLISALYGNEPVRSSGHETRTY